MPTWDTDYYKSLTDRFSKILQGLDARIGDVIEGRVAPPLDAIPIGSARSLRAAIVFFDIRGFSSLTSSADLHALKRTLVMLDSVIPMIMHVVHDYGGYVEKNTGDGLMAVVGADKPDSEAANAALDIATVSFYVLANIVNPALAALSIPAVDARIGIDLGPILLARIGVATGSASHDRNFLTAVGPAANLACKLQQMAGTNQIWTGDLIRVHAAWWRQPFFLNVTPLYWPWTYTHAPFPQYSAWNYNATRRAPDVVVPRFKSLPSFGDLIPPPRFR